MKARPKVFLSYSSQDQSAARSIEKALEKRGLGVWRDVHSVAGGSQFENEIEAAIRSARGLVVLGSEKSLNSPWVVYEYAFASGARVPVVAVVKKGLELPKPLQRFQTIAFGGADVTALKIEKALDVQLRSSKALRAVMPRLAARFQEVDGVVASQGSRERPTYWIDLWIENAPVSTNAVAFELLDRGYREPKWTMRRSKRRNQARDFLTDDMSSWGDVAIWAQGLGPPSGRWSLRTTLYAALAQQYAGERLSDSIRSALKQIKEC